MAKTEVKIDKNFGSLNFIDRLRTNPSCIGAVVNELAKMPLEGFEGSVQNLVSYEVDDKIRFNDLKTNRHLIEDYGLYEKIIVDVYSTVEEYQPNAKLKIWKRLKNEYRRIKAEIINTEKEAGNDDIDIIREYSDYIIDNTKSYLNTLITNSNNLDNTITEEDIESSIEIIIADAFVNCKILENPNIVENK